MARTQQDVEKLFFEADCSAALLGVGGGAVLFIGQDPISKISGASTAISAYALYKEKENIKKQLANGELTTDQACIKMDKLLNENVAWSALGGTHLDVVNVFGIGGSLGNGLRTIGKSFFEEDLPSILGSSNSEFDQKKYLARSLTEKEIEEINPIIASVNDSLLQGKYPLSTDLLLSHENRELIAIYNQGHPDNQISIIEGNDFGETIYGTAGNDNISGGGGNDTIYGGDGNDTIYGGADDDTIYGDVYHEVVEILHYSDGTTEKRTYIENSLKPGNDTIYGGDGNDTIYGGDGNDNIYGDAGNDEIHGGDGNDTIHGGAGDDIIYGDIGDDCIEGGDGNDTIYGGDGNDKIYGGAGDDIIYGDIGDDYIEGGEGNDKIYGGDGNDNIYGDAGNDTIHGGDGNDTIHGGAGDDIIYGDIGDDYIEGGDGNDKIYGGAGVDEIHGGEGNDTIYGDDGNDIIYGDGGNDTIYGGAGNDTIYGDDDVYHASSYCNENVIYGGPGDDTIICPSGHYEIYWNLGDGNDTIQGYYNGTTTNKVSIILGPGVKKEDIEFTSYANLDTSPLKSLEINIKPTKEIIKLEDAFDSHYSNDFRYFNDFEIKLDNGEILSSSYIANNITVFGSENNDYFDRDGDFSQRIEGLGGDDRFSIGGRNTINGDFEYTIVGGHGNDEIDINSSTQGKKTIVWNIGDDKDTVDVFYSSNVVISFGEGIKPSDIYLAKNEYDLALMYKNDKNQGIVVEEYFWIKEYRFDQIEFADGTIIKAADIKTGCWASACTSSQPEVPDDGIIRPKKGASKTPGTAGNDEFELDSSVTKPNTVTAGDGNDVINVSSTNGHNIKGEAGNDTITADGSNKLTLDGGEGDDTITLTNSLYGTVKGGAGNDTITVENAQNLATVDLGTGNDKLTLTDSALTTLKLVDGKNTVKAENSTIKTINGGLDDDDIALSDESKSTTIKLNNGTNTLELDNSTVKTITGGAGDDTITLNGAIATTITAGLGDDTVTLNAGSRVTTVTLTNGINELNINGATVTTINGGKGTNTINVMSGSVAKLNGGTGADNVTLAADNTIAKLNAGDDVIAVTGSGVKAYGLAGDDILSTKNSNGNLLDGGVGNDVIVVDGATAVTVTGGKGSDSYELKNLQADGVITINNALKAKGDVDTMSIDRAAGSFTYTVDAKNNLTMTGNDGSQVVINGWKANGMAINFSDGERSVEEVNSFVHKDINVAATKAGAGTAYSDTFIIGAGAKVTSSISGYSKYDTLDLSNYADCDLELTSVKNNLAIKLTRDDKAVGTVTLKNFLTSTSQMTNVVVGDANYKIVQVGADKWNLSKNMGMLAEASLGFADSAAGTSYAEEEHKDAKLLVSGNA